MTTWNYEASPVAWAFRQDRSFASFIIGPVGSGKTVPSLQRIKEVALEQEASKDGWRKSRFAIVRNTMPELRGTTSITYGQVYPASKWGEIVWRSPATAYLRSLERKIEAEVNFIALDKPQDVRKLLSMELTAAKFNEVREIPKSVVTRMTERVGRFGLNERPTTWSGIWGDTNPPDADHWLYQWHYKETPAGFRFFKQPPGVLEVNQIDGGVEIIDENFPEYQGRRFNRATVLVWRGNGTRLVDCPVDVMHAAGRTWIVNPWMENTVALSRLDLNANPLGAGSYYGRSLAGKSLDEIRSYLQGVYTFVADGRRVVPQYNDEVHSRDHVPILEDAPILIGADIGGGTLQPSAILFQKHPRGTYLIHREVVCFDMGVKRFGELVAAALVEHFPRHVERRLVGTGWGDPAGGKRDEIFETKSFDFLRREFGINLQPAPTQDIKLRYTAIQAACERLIDGQPGFILSRKGCPTLRKGLLGAWFFKRMKTTNEERYNDTPAKTDASHVCDGTGYGLLGAGEFGRLGGTIRAEDRTPLIADGSFNVF